MNNEKNEDGQRRVTFALPDELYARIAAAADKEDRSVSSFVRQAIVERLDHGR